MARLTVVEGADLGAEFDLESITRTKTGGVILGRDPRVDVPLDDQAVSREHCRIEPLRRGWRIVDLGSRNRTFVNGDPIDTAVLRDGDGVRIGDTELRFADAGSAVDSGVASTIVQEVELDGQARARLFGEVRAGTAAANGATGAPGSGEASDAGATDVLERVRGLLDVSRRIVRTHSAAELLEEFLEAIGTALSVDEAAFLARDGKKWVARARYGGSGTVRLSSDLIDRAALERKAIISRGSAEGSAGGNGGGGASSLSVPVLRGEEVVGVVHASRNGGDAAAFEEADLELLDAACDPLAELLETLDERDRLHQENQSLLRSITGARRIIGASKPVREMLDFIQKAAPTPMTVLVEGETGTGKELVASAIHFSSPRRSRPFVPINCAALPENLVESELFGHERGAFTGAVHRKKGRFELGDTGTVFLDEIGELSLPCQAKLLRLLEERCLERVGGTEAIPIDVRVVAATNADLPAAVAEGRFREDLYYRLNVLHLKIPPLRERREDIPLLVEHFLASAAAGGRPRRMSRSAMKRLVAYSWPGNVRQLRNVIESATVLAAGPEIRPDDLSLTDRPRASGGSSWEPISLQQLERQHVLRVLEHTGGNKKRAAEILGIERCTLYSKLKSYDL